MSFASPSILQYGFTTKSHAAHRTIANMETLLHSSMPNQSTSSFLSNPHRASSTAWLTWVFPNRTNILCGIHGNPCHHRNHAWHGNSLLVLASTSIPSIYRYHNLTARWRFLQWRGFSSIAPSIPTMCVPDETFPCHQSRRPCHRALSGAKRFH